jgi:hypothetical protein
MSAAFLPVLRRLALIVAGPASCCLGLIATLAACCLRPGSMLMSACCSLPTLGAALCCLPCMGSTSRPLLRFLLEGVGSIDQGAGSLHRAHRCNITSPNPKKIKAPRSFMFQYNTKPNHSKNSQQIKAPCGVDRRGEHAKNIIVSH